MSKFFFWNCRKSHVNPLFTLNFFRSCDLLQVDIVLAGRLNFNKFQWQIKFLIWNDRALHHRVINVPPYLPRSNYLSRALAVSPGEDRLVAEFFIHPLHKHLWCPTKLRVKVPDKEQFAHLLGDVAKKFCSFLYPLFSFLVILNLASFCFFLWIFQPLPPFVFFKIFLYGVAFLTRVDKVIGRPCKGCSSGSLFPRKWTALRARLSWEKRKVLQQFSPAKLTDSLLSSSMAVG